MYRRLLCVSKTLNTRKYFLCKIIVSLLLWPSHVAQQGFRVRFTSVHPVVVWALPRPGWVAASHQAAGCPTFSSKTGSGTGQSWRQPRVAALPSCPSLLLTPLQDSKSPKFILPPSSSHGALPTVGSDLIPSGFIAVLLRLPGLLWFCTPGATCLAVAHT